MSSATSYSAIFSSLWFIIQIITYWCWCVLWDLKRELHFLKSWLGTEWIAMSCGSGSFSGSSSLQWDAWTSRTKRHFPHGFQKKLLRKPFQGKDSINVGGLLVHVCFRSIGRRPTPNTCSLLTLFKNRTGWMVFPSELQYTTAVSFSFFCKSLFRILPFIRTTSRIW
jgi:hypothetical protein